MSNGGILLRIGLLLLSCFTAFTIAAANARNNVVEADGVQILAPTPKPTPRPKVAPTPVPPTPTSTPTPTPTPIPIPIPKPPAPVVTPTPAPHAPKKKKVRAPAPAPRPRENASLPSGETTTLAKSESALRAEFGGGIDLGTSYHFPKVSLRVSIDSKWILGATILFADNFNSTDRRTALGANASFEYFFQRAFKGFSLRAHVGVLSLKTRTPVSESSATPMTLGGTLHWTELFAQRWTVGVGVGAQYANGARANRIDFNGLLPLLSAEVGFVF